MRALLCKEHGPAENLVVEDVPSPALGKGEIRIGVRACGVNYPDNLMITGKYHIAHLVRTGKAQALHFADLLARRSTVGYAG